MTERTDPMRLAATALALSAVPLAANADPARLMAYSDAAFQENYTAAVLDPFNAAAPPDGKIGLFGSQSSATMLGQLRTQKTDPQVDVVIMDTTTAAIACAEGLVEKVTPDMLPVLADLDPQAKDASGCGPAVTFDSFVLAYNTKAVTPPPTALSVLADPKWKGRVSITAPPSILAFAMTAVLAHAQTGDWQKADGAFAELRTMAPNVQTFDPQPDGYTLILNGTIDFSTGWNARSQLFHDRSGGLLGVMLPGEGTVRQINTINLVKGAPHRDAALAFMRYALSPGPQVTFAERMYYAPTNAKAQVPPAIAARLFTTPQDSGKFFAMDWADMVKLRDNWTQRWRREVISAGGR